MGSRGRGGTGESELVEFDPGLHGTHALTHSRHEPDSAPVASIEEKIEDGGSQL
jgi:hypothetical protein